MEFFTSHSRLMKQTIALILIILLSACSSSKDSQKQGEKLFHQVHIGKNNAVGCISCHSIKENETTVGPSLIGIGLRAGFLVKGLSAKQYLEQSIINPDGYIVNGYEPASMFTQYKNELSKKEVQQLVSYLESLRY